MYASSRDNTFSKGIRSFESVVDRRLDRFIDKILASQALVAGVAYDPTVFSHSELNALSQVNSELRKIVDQPWVWRQRCIAGLILESFTSQTRFPVPNWKLLYHYSLKHDRHDCFKVKVSTDIGMVNIYHPSTGMKDWLDSVTATVAALLGRNVHLHHLYPNGSIGKPCSPSEFFPTVIAITDACIHNHSSNVSLSLNTSEAYWSIQVETILSKVHLDLTKTQFHSFGQMIDKAGEYLGFQSGCDVHLIQPDGRSLSSRHLLLEDLRVTGGETFKITSIEPGNIRVERLAWNTLDTETVPPVSPLRISMTSDPAPSGWSSPSRAAEDYAAWWCDTPPAEKYPLTVPAATRAQLPTVTPQPRQRILAKSPVITADGVNPPRQLQSSRDARQFEFHPSREDWLLIGRRSGSVALVDVRTDEAIAVCDADSSPILGLAWLPQHPDLAVYGAALSGGIGLLKVSGDSAMTKSHLGVFNHLSSVSVNCTDDFVMASGFTRDVALFDLPTGKPLSLLEDIHGNFINILRFSNSMPHVFATTSFDSTCKLWDLRCCGSGSQAKPLHTARTPSLNVMCSFSRDDSRLLVSGLDSNISQLSVQRGLSSLDVDVRAAVPPRHSATNYRRSVYLSHHTPRYFVTAGTDETIVRLVDADSGESCGIISFESQAPLVQNEEERSPTQLFGSMVSRLLMIGRIRQTPTGSDWNIGLRTEYVQSIRSHPLHPTTLGVLMSPFESAMQPIISLVEMKSVNLESKWIQSTSSIEDSAALGL